MYWGVVRAALSREGKGINGRGLQRIMDAWCVTGFWLINILMSGREMSWDRSGCFGSVGLCDGFRIALVVDEVEIVSCSIDDGGQRSWLCREEWLSRIDKISTCDAS